MLSFKNNIDNRSHQQQTQRTKNKQIVDQAKSSFIPRAHAARFFGFVYGMFYIGKFLKECMLACLPVERVPRSTPPGRLLVVMASVLGWKSVRAREFRDGDDLIDALRCSCACFPLVMPHRFRGKRCFDGFFSEGASAPALNEEEAAVKNRRSFLSFFRCLRVALPCHHC